MRPGAFCRNLALWAAAHCPGCSHPFQQRPLAAWEQGLPRHSALPWSPQQERAAAIPQGRQEEPIPFLFPSQPILWGPEGRGREAGEGHLRLLFNETIHVQDRITCIRCTRLLIHLVIKQGITPGLLEPEMTAYFHPLHRWGN